MASIVPVILSGGMGTRLWPVSRSDRPKQFGRLVGEATLLQQTALRLELLDARDPIVVCNAAHGETVQRQLAGVGVTPRAVLLEPEGRNTAPAVAAAAYFLREHGDAEQVLLILPADHIILDRPAFAEAVQVAAAAALDGYLATFGIVPDHAETGYGYLKRGTGEGGVFAVERFVEKPDLATAERYVASGEYLWNSGMFAFTVNVFLEELERLQPVMARRVGEAVSAARARQAFLELDAAAFSGCPSDSIDYAVMEQTRRAVLVPLDAGWSDMGSWSAVAALQAPDRAGNTTRGDVLLHDCRNSHFHSSGRLVAGIGVQDHIVVETPDAVLVVHRDHAQDVKGLVDRLGQMGRVELRRSAADDDDAC